jgi:hypothetical protein
MNQQEKIEVAKKIKDLCEPIKQKVDGKEWVTALVCVAIGNYVESDTWYEELGHMCAVRALSYSWSKGMPFKVSPEFKMLEPFLGYLSDGQFNGVALLWYESGNYCLETAGQQPVIDWMIHEHGVRSDQIVRTVTGF